MPSADQAQGQGLFNYSWKIDRLAINHADLFISAPQFCFLGKTGKTKYLPKTNLDQFGTIRPPASHTLQTAPSWVGSCLGMTVSKIPVPSLTFET